MMPIFLRCDKGTETGKMASIHCYLMSTEHSMFDDPVESMAFGPSAGSFFLCLFSVYSLIFPSRVTAVAPSTIFLQVNRFCVFLPQLSYSPVFQVPLEDVFVSKSEWSDFSRTLLYFTIEYLFLVACRFGRY